MLLPCLSLSSRRGCNDLWPLSLPIWKQLPRANRLRLKSRPSILGGLQFRHSELVIVVLAQTTPRGIAVALQAHPGGSAFRNKFSQLRDDFNVSGHIPKPINEVHEMLSREVKNSFRFRAFSVSNFRLTAPV